MKIPSFNEAYRSKMNGTLNPLEKFILEFEPGSFSCESRFRNQLQMAVNFVRDPVLEHADNPDSNI